MKPQETMSPLPFLPPRRPDSHKGDFGRALLVGGSRGMAGAISLAGLAALRSGAGLVTLGVSDTCQETVAGFAPDYMTWPLPCDRDGRLIVAAKDEIGELADRSTCIACGPGLGRSPQLTALVTWMYQVIPQPIVFDADGLFALSEHPEVLDEPAGPRVLTPHPGEFLRLTSTSDLTREQMEIHAGQLAANHGVVVVLKGHRTLITDGRQACHNTTGNPGMATGGAGDVLTGVITALICQGLAPFDAARLGVYLHGLAGDLAAAELGQVGLIASDLVAYLPRAFLQLEG